MSKIFKNALTDAVLTTIGREAKGGTNLREVAQKDQNQNNEELMRCSCESHQSFLW